MNSAYIAVGCLLRISMEFFKKISAALVFALGLQVGAQAAVIGIDGFASSTVIDFEDAPLSLIGGFYSGLGVTMAHISGGSTNNVGHGPSKVGTNFGIEGGFPDGELFFSSLQTRVGMDITTNDYDDTTIFAFLGSTLIGAETFNTFGNGFNGSFIGVEFSSGFDRIVIDTFGPVNGAFGIDNLRFNVTPSAAIPEPATLLLLGLGLLGIAVLRRR